MKIQAILRNLSRIRNNKSGSYVPSFTRPQCPDSREICEKETGILREYQEDPIACSLMAI